MVKNGYDVDSKVSIVYFDNKYSTFHEEIDENHFEELLNKGVSKSMISNYQKDGVYIVNKESKEDERNLF